MNVDQWRERRRKSHRLDKLIVFALTTGVLFFVLWRTIFIAIPAGNVAVLFRLFNGGTYTGQVYREGLMIKWPWDACYLYEVRTQTRNYSVDALGSNGLTVHADFTALFHPIPQDLPLLHREIGPDYIDRLVTPVSLDAVRQVIAQYGPQTLNTVPTAVIQKQILERLRNNRETAHLLFESVVIRRLALPESLNNAINAKLTEEQYEQAYDFRIEREKKEAVRKHIEAVGIQNFYSIVANALTPSLLTWRGIEATVEVSRSPNSKIVIMGGGKNQLPLILGSEISNLPTSPKSVAPVNPDKFRLPDFDRLPSLFPDTGTVTSNNSPASKPETAQDQASSPSATVAPREDPKQTSRSQTRR
jgi:regulator of protease activity HflC (stomatin/prohibitin superfamily)